jgi:hypothetical protein
MYIHNIVKVDSVRLLERIMYQLFVVPCWDFLRGVVKLVV